MKPIIAMDHTVVAVHHGDEIVHVLVDIEAPEVPGLERAPLDVILVLDRSGSMAGRPLEAVTNAAAEVLRLAHPDDRIGVVTFDSDADMVLPLDHRHGEAGGHIVRSINSGGSTNLSGGWLKAFEMLSTSPRENAVRRIIFLTDGHANAGISNGDQLAELVTTGHSADISTSFIGFADGFDEDMLEKLADAGQGNNYYCESADQASAVFTTEFNGLASVVAQNISVEVAPGAPVASATALNVFTTGADNDDWFQAVLSKPLVPIVLFARESRKDIPIVPINSSCATILRCSLWQLDHRPFTTLHFVATIHFPETVTIH